MATYGYSAGYQGGGPSAVPSGYIEAYAQAGRNIGQGVQAIGNAIGESLQRYGQNKAENEFVQARYEQLRPYIDVVARTGNVMDERSPESKLLADVGKFSAMSLPQKKAALMNAEFFLDRADKQRARELTDEATRQQLALGALQLGDIQEKRRQNEILTSAIRYGLEQPTTTTQTQQVTDTIEFPPMPGVPTPAVQSTPSQAEATAARYFMGRYGQAAQQLQQYGAGLGRQANALNVSQTPRFTGPISLGQEDNEAYLSQQFESPIEAAARAEANTRLKEQQLAESQAALQQAGIMSRSPALQTIRPRTLQPAQETAPMQQPPETITRNVSTQVPISYEDQSKRLTQFLVQQGARPETLAMVPQILSMVGQQRPTRVEQVGNIGSVVRFGDKEQFVPAKEANIGDMLKVKGLTIDFPEFRGTAPTEKEATDFRDQYSNVLTSRRNIQRLLEIAQMGKATQQTPEIKAEAEQLARAAQGALRLDIIGPGTVTDSDRKLLENIVRNPTDIFSLQSSNVKSLKSLLERAGSGIESKAKSIGLEVLKPDQQQKSAVGTSLLSDPRVAAIRARAASGAITRQQAVKEIESLK
jgi:hypothetical protein